MLLVLASSHYNVHLTILGLNPISVNVHHGSSESKNFNQRVDLISKSDDWSQLHTLLLLPWCNFSATNNGCLHCLPPLVDKGTINPIRNSLILWMASCCGAYAYHVIPCHHLHKFGPMGSEWGKSMDSTGQIDHWTNDWYWKWACLKSIARTWGPLVAMIMFNGTPPTVFEHAWNSAINHHWPWPLLSLVIIDHVRSSTVTNQQKSLQPSWSFTIINHA